MKKFFTPLFVFIFILNVAKGQLIVATGSLATPRESHITELLNNGKVLAAGGTDLSQINSPTYKTAELYNPSSGTWSGTGSMKKNRCNFASVLLDNGNVMVIGGDYDSNNPFWGSKSCEIYDVNTGTWSYTDSMENIRSFPMAVKLDNGKILAIGGSVSSPCELYDQSNGTWSTTGSTNELGGPWSKACKMNDGRVFLCGSGSDKAEIYDPNTGSWTIVPNTLNETRDDCSVITMNDGRVLIAGGIFTLTAEVFDPSNNTFTATDDMLHYHVNCDMINLTNGQVLIAGIGDAFNFSNKESLEVYSPASNKWHLAGVVPINIFSGQDYGMHRLQNGKILLAGGEWAAVALPNCNLINENLVIVGIEDIEFNAQISLYPNPTSHHFTIDISDNGRITSIFISDLSGREIYRCETNQLRIYESVQDPDFPKLVPGAYVLQAVTENGILKKKLVID